MRISIDVWPIVWALALAGCVPGGGGSGNGEGDGGAAADGAPALPADGQGGVVGGDACGDIAQGTSMRLPGTGVGYCLGAHPDCAQAGADCPLYVTSNTAGAYFDRLAEQPLIVALSTGARDGDGVKDWVAELPRVVARDWPGLDPGRIYMVGWSAGAGAVFRGQCQAAKGYDESTFGTTSDIYAAIATLGGCPNCSEGFAQRAGNFHVFATNGRDDQFGGDGCEARLRQRATVNRCARLDAAWTPVAPDDAWVADAPGTAVAEKLDFRPCPDGDVVGYRFADEGHVVSYRTHFDPRIRAYDLVWAFLQGKTK